MAPSLYFLRTLVAFTGYSCTYACAFLPDGYREAVGSYALALCICLCVILRSALHCCTGGRDQHPELQPPMKKLFHPAPGPDLLENLCTLAVLLLSFPFAPDRSVALGNVTDVQDSVQSVWNCLGASPAMFKLVQTVVRYYVARPPTPFTRRCMNIVTALSLFEGGLYTVLTLQGYGMVFLATRLVDGSTVLPQPNLLLPASSYAGAVAVAGFLGLLVLLRIFWLLRGVVAVLSLASARNGRGAKRFRHFARGAGDIGHPSKYSASPALPQPAVLSGPGLRQRAIAVGEEVEEEEEREEADI
jgi:hypothetical protein